MKTKREQRCGSASQHLAVKPDDAHACVIISRLGGQVAELLVGVPAPVLYWEQGHEWLFGDPVRFQARTLGTCQFACTGAPGFQLVLYHD